MTNLDRHTQIENLVNQIRDLSSDNLVILNNIYCHEINDSDNEIHSNDEDFFETFFAGRPHEVARAISFGDYEYSAEWVRFNGYGNLESIDCMTVDDLVEFPAQIAEYALDNQSEFEHLLNFDFNNN